MRARRQVFSQLAGNNASRYKGEGYDFAELRQYQIGDDIKHIDWNITAKMQTPYVKLFHEERELNVTLVAMMGGSLHFGTQRLKQEAVAEVVALLGYSAIKNQDRITTILLQEAIHKTLPPSKSTLAVHRGVDEVLGCEVVNHHANYEGLDSLLMPRLRHKSLIIIVGDFFALPEIALLSKRHEVVAVIVRDRVEEQPKAMGFASLIDPENGAVLEGDFGASRIEGYAQKVRLHDAQLFDVLKKNGVRFTKIYSDENPYAKLRRLFGAL
ncbi:MAG: hypothetical protein KU37_05215 [Sulfuricurvum sp. PC08-66]|nr:MAG: hypothetical protein KU37_05215 [Sulfuricurvum sp. PC08-66]